MQFFDTHPGVFKWNSEEISIPYIKPTDGKVHRYFPDFYVVYVDKSGNQMAELIEVKPLKEVIITERSSQYDIMNIAINEAKWAAAREFCAAHNMTFRVLTEVSIFNKRPKPPRTKKTKPNNATKSNNRTKQNNRTRGTARKRTP